MACSAQITHTMHPLWSRSALTVWRAVTPCCHAMLACSMRAQHASDTTTPACMRYFTRTCPRPSARLGCIQVGEADDETSRQRGVWDVPEHQPRPVVAQKGRSGGHSGEDHGTAFVDLERMFVDLAYQL